MTISSALILANPSPKCFMVSSDNAHAKHPSPRNQDPDEYAASTGFEALLGFLYLTGQNSRIGDLVNHIREVNAYV